VKPPKIDGVDNSRASEAIDENLIFTCFCTYFKSNSSIGVESAKNRLNN
jgi:hypothetical protein